MQYSAKLYNKIKKFSLEKRISFHMPVHGGEKLYGKRYVKKLMSFDVTELDETDNLYAPEGAIKDMHENMAKLFGAKNAHFIAGGSSSALHAMLLSSLKRGEKLLVDSCVHISVINACVLYGIEPVFINREICPDFCIAAPITPSLLKKAIEDNPDAKAVLITSPTYYGVCSPIAELADITHEHDMIFLVDCAHGSHFAFCDNLPNIPAFEGADMCAVSLHKTLGAPTQAALLLYNSEKIPFEKVKTGINMVQTTSPSYMLMCSSDFICEKMARYGQRLFDKAVMLTDYAKTKIEQKTKCKCLSNEGGDLSRLVINLGAYDITGDGMAKSLSEKYKIDVEMAESYNIVCIIGPVSTKSELNSLIKAICEILSGTEARKDIGIPKESNPIQMKMSLCGAFFNEGELVPIEKSCGRICADTVSIYPPGIACLVPGALIDEKIIKGLQNAQNQKRRITGMHNGKVRVVK